MLVRVFSPALDSGQSCKVCKEVLGCSLLCLRYGSFGNLEDIVVSVHQNVHIWEDKLLVDQRSHFLPCLLRHLSTVDFMQILRL